MQPPLKLKMKILMNAPVQFKFLIIFYVFGF